MIRIGRTLTLAVIGLTSLDLTTTHAQMKVQGAKTVVINPDNSVVERQTLVVRKRRPWRERNPYFVARPTYAPAVPGERARVTFAPFSSLYYPNSESYYPPLNAPSAAPRR